MKQCFECTQDQIELLAKAICKRKIDDLEMQAKLHGTDIKKKQRGASDLERDWDMLKVKGLI